jgi:CIC family chloride channel protein
MNAHNWYHQFLLWRMKYLSNRNFIIISSFVVGLFGGLAAVVLKTVTHYIQQLLTLGIPARYHNYLFFIYPLIGILLTVLYKISFRIRHARHGIPGLLMDISKKSGMIEPEGMYNDIVTSSFTVGFGGSVGLEAPIVATGAAIGSNLAKLFHMGRKKRILLLSCGVAAGIAGIFNAPITGIIFCLEVMLLDLSVPAFIPLLISAVTGTLVAQVFLGHEILFNYAHSDPFYNREIPFYILLGIFTGMLSVWFLNNFKRTNESLHKVHDDFKRAILGGLLLGLMIFIFPPLYGEGYENMKDLISKGAHFALLRESFFFDDNYSNWFLLAFIGVMLLVKAFASAATIGAGGNGGSFAPSVFNGGIAGFFASRLINSLHILPFQLSERNFILVGMAGMLSGVLHAPLTAIFLMAEITSGYTLILPLMIVSAISFVTSSYFSPHSVYIQQLANQGHVHFHDKDRTVLTELNLRQMLEKDLIPVDADGNLREVIQAVSQSKRNIFPVIEETHKMVGIIDLNDIRHLMFKPEFYDKMTVRELMHPPQAYILHTDSMEDVMKKFDITGAWNLPVVDKNNIYIGLMSKSKIFSHYRSLLKKQVKEDTEIIE